MLARIVQLCVCRHFIVVPLQYSVMPKKVEQYELLPLFHRFINEARRGKYLQKNGKKLKPDSLLNYVYLETLLHRFSSEKGFALRLKNSSNLSKTKFEEEKKYWKDFYIKFTTYLYEDRGHFDNYVGRMLKLLRSFFNYLNTEKGLNVGSFHRQFYIPSEDIDIVVLSPERFNYLLQSEELEEKLPLELRNVKDVFLFGCSVALRFSDLMSLRRSNLEKINERYYIKVQSKKTQTYTRVKLPEYAVKILGRFSSNPNQHLLPEYNKVYFNRKIKVLMEQAGFTEEIQRTRQRRGIPVQVYRDKSRKPFRFCDAVTTHTMRRSAITTMLSLGMSEQTVRQISGHSPNSKDFYRYVAFAQTYIDTEIDQMHQKLENKTLHLTAEMR